MFNTLIVQPLFNILMFIYALLPGHDFGMAIIIFTILIRLLLWPIIKKQLQHTKKLRELQPELKKIKAASKGDKQKESKLTMELYKERKINPFATLGLTLLQFPVLIGLYIGLQKAITHPDQIINFCYPFVRDLSWMKELAKNPELFNPTLFGIIDLEKAALSNGVWYIPGLILVTLSAVGQYFTSKQLLPEPSEKKGLRQILKDAGRGNKADQQDMQAATGRFTSMMIPFIIFFVTLRIASALSLYWFTSSVVAYIQQARVLRTDEEAMEAVTAKADKKVIEGEVIDKPTKAKKKSPKKSKAKKRRK